ncbi:MAG: lipid IV(A) 3-deoxy-D-manno-octulosonic acid transferase [Phyllobacteriaceae bacterium]|nr:lipid IV(A) 3-deoxy-D-manno-octulosonic acid transferase [Phyllobacteriaceae bacterium]
MSARWARSLLTTYRLAGAAAYPMIGPYVAWRAAKGKEDPARRRERYGFASRERPPGPVVWVHAASIGETSAVMPLIHKLSDEGVAIVLTTGTTTSARMAEERLGKRIIHQYVPLDLKPAVSRFLAHWLPDLAVFAESELWPMTILELGARRVPQVLVNARLSDRSFASWRKRLWLAEALFENLSLVVAQSSVDGDRFSELGARPVHVSGNLKTDTPPPPADDDALAALRQQIGARPTWAAVSTHEGEEVVAAEVHRLLASRHRDLLTIVVPRHPERAAALEAQIRGLGLDVARRSRHDPVTAETDILIGDTIGDMGLYLRLTEIAFVGRSMTAEGGQNPLEPAMLSTAVLTGHGVHNFREAYDQLVRGGGARFVKDREMLAGAVNYLLKNPETRRAMASAGLKTVTALRGSLDRTLRALEPFIQPLFVKARIDSAARRTASR